jgi:hypothetical protein
MMQMSRDEIVRVISVLHGLMAAGRTVNVRGIVTATAMVRCASIGICRAREKETHDDGYESAHAAEESATGA